VASVGFVVHSQRAGALALAEETSAWLRAEGHGAQQLDTERGIATWETLDLAVSLGGDGTMLRTVDLVSPHGVPVLGVNLGHLGYLTAVEPSGLRDALGRFLAGDYQLESRLTLDVSVTDDRSGDGPTVLHRSALNDVVLQRTSPGRTMRAEVSVNGVAFLKFASDSLILATPTGSTAYNLSARGPIVSPRAQVQILTPVAPHMLFDRSLVLSADEVLSVVPIANPVDVVIDGWLATKLHPGQTIHSRRGDKDARLVTFGGRDFHSILKNKFNLADW
jgi:NAD+ kinase